jgi:hypothetical protein
MRRLEGDRLMRRGRRGPFAAFAQRLGVGADAGVRGTADYDHMPYAMSHILLTATSTAGAAWLMIRAAAAKKMITVQTPSRCVTCGKRRNRGRCGCTDGPRG